MVFNQDRYEYGVKFIVGILTLHRQLRYTYIRV